MDREISKAVQYLEFTGRPKIRSWQENRNELVQTEKLYLYEIKGKNTFKKTDFHRFNCVENEHKMVSENVKVGKHVTDKS